MLNGFASYLNADQLKKLSSMSEVKSIIPNKSFSFSKSTSTDEVSRSTNLALSFGLSGKNGLWKNKFGGNEKAGDGVVIGVLDSGINPQSPSFYGKPMGQEVSSEKPYRLGKDTFYKKSDGTIFPTKVSSQRKTQGNLMNF